MKDMDDGARKYLFKYIRANFWRVASWIEFDDLVQTGYLAYYEVGKRYPEAVEPSHIMSLFQLVLRSKIEDMVRANTKQPDVPDSVILDEASVDIMNIQLLLMRSPEVIRKAISVFSDEGMALRQRRQNRKLLQEYFV